MLIFKQGLETIVTIHSIDQLFDQVEGAPSREPYQTDATLPDFANNPGKFYYPTDNWPNENSFQLGATRTYAKTTEVFSTGDVYQFSMCCLPTPPSRTADTVIYYQPDGSGLKVLVTSRTWDPGTAQYEFIHNPNTLSLTIYNGTNKDVYGPVTVSGRNTVTAYSVAPLSYENMVDEQVIVSTLGEQIFSKEWVEKYINDRLEVVIPQAVDQAVKQSEIVISQRYVSR